tara:strand:+ start:1314 stop:2177 length:864 start_codon:yes stop_codon:yes gene_type:complete
MYQNKKTPLTDFTEELSAAHHLNNSSFSDLYSWHYFDISEALKKEIIGNLNSLSTDRFNAYIKYVENEIHEVYGYYDPNECIIDKWIQKFGLIEEHFPFYHNDEVQWLLCVNKKNDKSESKKKGINIGLMQLEFHWYAGHLEYLKMKLFIDELLTKESGINMLNKRKSDISVPYLEKGGSIDENKTSSIKLENPHPQIFSSPLAFKLFEKLHESYKTTKKQTADYSFIYRAMYDDGYILDSCKNTMFINWLSKNYNIVPVKIKTKDNCSTDSKVQNYNTVKELLQIK